MPRASTVESDLKALLNAFVIGIVRIIERAMHEQMEGLVATLGGRSRGRLDRSPMLLLPAAGTMEPASHLTAPSPRGEQSAPAAGRRRSPRPPPSREELEELLRKHRGNVAHVAREMDRRWAVVRRWIVDYRFDMKRFRRL